MLLGKRHRPKCVQKNSERRRSFERRTGETHCGRETSRSCQGGPLRHFGLFDIPADSKSVADDVDEEEEILAEAAARCGIYGSDSPAYGRVIFTP